MGFAGGMYNNNATVTYIVYVDGAGTYNINLGYANGFETIDVGSQKREFLYLLPKKDQQ